MGRGVSLVDMSEEPDMNAYHTYEDYYHYRLEGGYELAKGWLRKMATPLDPHQAIVTRASSILDNYFLRSPCIVRVSPYDVRLFAGQGEIQDTVVQPDVCVICDS